MVFFKLTKKNNVTHVFENAIIQRGILKINRKMGEGGLATLDRYSVV